MRMDDERRGGRRDGRSGRKYTENRSGRSGAAYGSARRRQEDSRGRGGQSGTAGNRSSAANNRRRTADRRYETAADRREAADNRRRAAGNRARTSGRGGGRRAYTEEELRILRRRQQLRRKKAKQRRQRQLAALLACFCAVCYLCFRVVAGIFGFIENSRAAQRGEVETVQETSGLDLTESVEDSGESAGAAAQPTAAVENADPTHVFSNGRYVDTTKPMVALTFDDGPKTDVGNSLMDQLEAVDGRGTFFIVGERLDEHKEEIQRMYNNGHEIANHSWDHDLSLTSKGVDYIRSEFSKTDDKLREIVGIETSLVRLPGGRITDDVKTAVSKPMMYWSLDTEDWKSRNAASVEAMVDGQVKDGDIILMHELYSSTAEACQEIIPRLAAEGFQLVTVSELIQFRGATVEGNNGKQYECFRPQETTAAETSEAETTAAEAETAGENAGGAADGSAEAASEGAG